MRRWLKRMVATPCAVSRGVVSVCAVSLVAPFGALHANPSPMDGPARAGSYAAPPATAPAPVVWEKKGVRLSYPGEWHTKKSADYELMLLPAGATTEDRRITFDIPDLPPHLPFMIQISQVQKEYVADLKKRIPIFTSTKPATPTAPMPP